MAPRSIPEHFYILEAKRLHLFSQSKTTFNNQRQFKRKQLCVPIKPCVCVREKIPFLSIRISLFVFIEKALSRERWHLEMYSLQFQIEIYVWICDSLLYCCLFFYWCQCQSPYLSMLNLLNGYHFHTVNANKQIDFVCWEKLSFLNFIQTVYFVQKIVTF